MSLLDRVLGRMTPGTVGLAEPKDVACVKDFTLYPGGGATTFASPPPGHYWELMSGAIHHVTGTATVVAAGRVATGALTHFFFAFRIPAGSATALYGIDLYGCRVLLRPEDTLMHHEGDANSIVMVRVLEKTL